MPQYTNLNGKSVMMKIRNARPILATIKITEEMGVWIAGTGDLTAEAFVLTQHIQNPMLFVPWTSVDWIAVPQ
jgi:hypothetical protein